jgi:hypothetical protein
VHLIKGFFLSALALGLGLPHQSTLAPPDNGRIGRKDRLSISKTAADAVIKGLLSSAFDMKKWLESSRHWHVPAYAAG